MTPRERAQARLGRHVPDFGHWDVRQPARRVAGREDLDPRPEREVVGASVRVRDGEGEVRSAPTVHPGPNAPLLMRIVRDPYALRPGSAERVRYLPEGASEQEEPAVRLADVVREKREALRASRPLREIDHRPVERERPFARVRQRLDAGEGS